MRRRTARRGHYRAGRRNPGYPVKALRRMVARILRAIEGAEDTTQAVLTNLSGTGHGALANQLAIVRNALDIARLEAASALAVAKRGG